MQLDETCSICRNRIKVNEIVTTPCKHRFCNSCFFNWMERKSNCPICRKEFTTTSVLERQRIEELVAASRDWEDFIDDLKSSCSQLETQLNNIYKEVIEEELKAEKAKQALSKLNEEYGKKKVMMIKQKEEWEVMKVRRAAYIKEWNNLQTAQQQAIQSQRTVYRNRFRLKF